MKLCGGQCASCELNSSRHHPRVISALLTVLSLPLVVWDHHGWLDHWMANSYTWSLDDQVFSLKSGSMESLHSTRTLPLAFLVKFLVSREIQYWLGEVLSSFFSAKLLCSVFMFISTNSIKAVELKWGSRSPFHSITQSGPLSVINRANPSIFQPAISTVFQPGGADNLRAILGSQLNWEKGTETSYIPPALTPA